MFSGFNSICINESAFQKYSLKSEKGIKKTSDGQHTHQRLGKGTKDKAIVLVWLLPPEL